MCGSGPLVGTPCSPSRGTGLPASPDQGCLFLLLHLSWQEVSPRLCLVGVPSSPGEGACPSEQDTWVYTQKNRLGVNAFSLTYDFPEQLVPHSLSALSGLS